ncbi:DUF6233 domain-containing protein [Streptomyces griseofuscus]|uniref:DUF6233 domain-containing protein n=1 Tax=Streptomyces griseofuscus TaxID=146922 RepID=UPI0036B2957A
MGPRPGACAAGRRRRLRPGPTDRLKASAPPSAVREILGERRPIGWVVQKTRIRRGPARRALHAPDCTEAPHDAPLLDLKRALDVAENPATTLCTLCGGRAGDHAGAARLRPHRRWLSRGLISDRCLAVPARAMVVRAGGFGSTRPRGQAGGRQGGPPA